MQVTTLEARKKVIWFAVLGMTNRLK
jgi:hypothetical protein